MSFLSGREAPGTKVEVGAESEDSESGVSPLIGYRSGGRRCCLSGKEVVGEEGGVKF